MFFDNGIPVNNEEYSFIFNNNNSLRFDLVLAEYPSIPRIREDVEYISIEGKSESYQKKKGTYKRDNISLKVRLLDINAMWDYVESIEEWLLGRINSNKLYIDRRDKYFVVREVQIGNIVKEIKMYGEFTITFVVEPFMYEDGIETVPTIRDNLEHTTLVQGDFKVEPTVEIIGGSGDITITINDKTTTIEDVNGDILIDRFICLDKTNNKDKSVDVQGSYPILDKGVNTIKCEGTFENVIIKFKNKYR